MDRISEQSDDIIGITTSHLKTEEAVPKDRISELPDSVIGIIISHLKTKAVKTSVLSSRWKYLWKLSTRLNFDALENISHMISFRKEQGRNYIRWVEQVADNYENSYLDILVVASCFDSKHTSYLNKLISFAVSKRAKTIKLLLIPYYYYDVNRRSKAYSFFTSAPALSGIECLTSLCLKYVEVTGELIEQLLSVCPLLERLSLAYTKNLRNLKVIGSSLKLKYFEIVYCYDLKSIQISAPNLVSFRFKNNWMSEIGEDSDFCSKVENLSSLVDFYILDTNSYVFSQFSFCFFQLEILTLSCPLNEILLNLLGHFQFTSLKHLTFIDDFHGRDYMQCLPDFISLCPVLHKFTLNLTNRRARKIKWEERRLDNLRVVELIRISGNCEIEIAMFFLRNAIRLEKLIIEHEPWTSSRKELVEKLVPQGVELLIKQYELVKS